MTTSLEFALRSLSKRSHITDRSSLQLPRLAKRAVLIIAGLLSTTVFAQSPPPNSAPPSDSRRSSIVVPTPPPAGSLPSNTSVSAPSGYTLSANDQVAVEVFGEDELRTAGRLSADGNLSLPLLGSVHLGGLTLGQATARLTELYGRDYLVNPKVNVSLAGYAKRRFTMLGQINRPGSYEMPEGSSAGIDLLEAVAMAGGYTRIAAPERISVRRKSGNGDQVLRINGKQIAKGGGFRVEPGDTVTIGESIF